MEFDMLEGKNHGKLLIDNKCEAALRESRAILALHVLHLHHEYHPQCQAIIRIRP